MSMSSSTSLTPPIPGNLSLPSVPPVRPGASSAPCATKPSPSTISQIRTDKRTKLEPKAIISRKIHIKEQKPKTNAGSKDCRSHQRRDGPQSPCDRIEQDDPKSLLGQAIVDDFRNHWTLDKLARYETRLENSMIRCLDKFQKVRESQMMNFTSLRHYYRGFTRRPQDFQDEPKPLATYSIYSEGSITSAACTREARFTLQQQIRFHIENEPKCGIPDVTSEPSAVLPASDRWF